MKKVSEGKEFSFIGKRIERVDALPKVTGEAKYFGDVKLPDTLIGKMLRSPHSFSRQKSRRRKERSSIGYNNWKGE